MKEFVFGSGDKLLITGDSITDANRSQPAGEGLFGALGTGYVTSIDALIQSTYPELMLRIVNKGTSGNTIRDLKDRWQVDVLDQKPDWVVVMIGTNDVWRQFDTPWQKEWQVQPDEYQDTYVRLIEQTKSEVKGLFLATPFYLEPNKEDLMRKRMDEYGQIVKTLATRYDLPLIDTQAAFDDLLETFYPATLAWDRVHPNAVGCMTLARAFLNVFGFDWTKCST